VSISPERNEIDISKLFNWGKEVSIVDNNGKDIMKVWLRLVGDSELNRARVFALRKSAEMRLKLKDLDSDERLAYIPDKSVVEKDNLVSYILYVQSKNFASKASASINIPFPKEPDSGAELEEQEKYQKEIDDYPKKVEEAMSNLISKDVEAEKVRLDVLTFDELYKLFENYTINDTCEKAMLEAFREQCAYYGSYKDKKYEIKLFKNFEQFLNLPTDIKNQFTSNYETLEIGTEELKK
jgi:hypothetical protein